MNETKNETALETMTAKWMQLERKTVKQREIAEQFYEKNLMKLIEEDFIKRNKKKLYENVEYLIMSVGTSYEPLVLNISLLQPDKIFFLCTKQTEKYLDKVVKYCGLPSSRFQKAIVSETDPVDIYREIKQAYTTWGQPEKMYIDFTGGTKAMSAAGAMAGAMINVQLVYVGTNEYLPDFRKPNPGSETLYYITNPVEIFGDLEIEKAFTLFERHNYSGASKKLEELKDKVPDPTTRQQLEFAYLLSCVYEAWDALEFNKAYKYIVELNKQIKRDRKTHGQLYECCGGRDKAPRVENARCKTAF
jgi:CRISPR-associated protein (TIGR02710 family)